MTDNELTTTDVLADPLKNLCNIYQDNQNHDEHEADNTTLCKNEYYTESDFIDFVETSNLTDNNHVLIYIESFWIR